jgi:hypothetical protein
MSLVQPSPERAPATETDLRRSDSVLRPSQGTVSATRSVRIGLMTFGFVRCSAGRDELFASMHRWQRARQNSRAFRQVGSRSMHHACSILVAAITDVRTPQANRLFSALRASTLLQWASTRPRYGSKSTKSKASHEVPLSCVAGSSPARRTALRSLRTVLLGSQRVQEPRARRPTSSSRRSSRDAFQDRPQV